MTAITAFSQQIITPEFDHPRAERLLDGNPQRSTWNHFTNDTGEVCAGIWASEVGSWRIAFGPREDEFFCVIEGRCRITV